MTQEEVRAHLLAEGYEARSAYTYEHPQSNNFAGIDPRNHGRYQNEPNHIDFASEGQKAKTLRDKIA